MNTKKLNRMIRLSLCGVVAAGVFAFSTAAMAAVPNPAVSGVEAAAPSADPEAEAAALAAQIVAGFSAAR